MRGARTAGDGEVLPTPGALLDADVAAVQRDQLGDQRQPDAGALVGADRAPAMRWNRSNRRGLLGRRDADAGVGDGRARRRPSTVAQADRDAARRR